MNYKSECCFIFVLYPLLSVDFIPIVHCVISINLYYSLKSVVCFLVISSHFFDNWRENFLVFVQILCSIFLYFPRILLEFLIEIVLNLNSALIWKDILTMIIFLIQEQGIFVNAFSILYIFQTNVVKFLMYVFHHICSF